MGEDERKLNKLFVIGCPRSGTTWVQLLLAQHPQVATAQETHLFNGYIAPLDAAWRRQRESPRGIGLSATMTEAEFYGLCRDFAEAVLSKVAAANPKAEVIVEKTPAHGRHVSLIRKIVPDALFLHVVRDPRGAVSSLCAAGSSWGSRWASRNVEDNARLWRSDVNSARSIRNAACYREVRYEDLLGPDGARYLQRLFEWLELEAVDGLCSQIMEICRIDNLRKADRKIEDFNVLKREPNGFYRKGVADGWREDLSARDIRVVEYITGELMQQYGYEAMHKTGSRRRPAALVMEEARRRAEWRLKRLVEMAVGSTRA